MKKRLSLLMVLMMVLSLVPMSVFATAGTMPGGAIKVDDTDEETYKEVIVKLTQASGTKFTPDANGDVVAKITLNKGEFAQVDNKPLVYSDGVAIQGGALTSSDEINGLDYLAGTSTTEAAGEISAAKAIRVLTRSVSVPASKAGVSTGVVPATLEMDPAVANVAYIKIDAANLVGQGTTTFSDEFDIVVAFNAYFDRVGSGDFTVSVNEVNSSGLDVSKPIVSGVVAEGTGEDMKMVVADATKKISFDGGELSTITIKDIDKNSGVDYLELELPDYVKWDLRTGETKASLGGVTVVLTSTTANPHIARVQIVGAPGVTNPTEKELIIVPKVTVTKRDASKGDVRLKVVARNAANTKLETIDAIVGQVADYDVTMTAWEKGKKEIPAMYGGDDKVVKVKLSGVKGSFTNNRSIDFTIKGADIEYASLNPLRAAKNLTLDATSVKDDGGNVEDGEFTLVVNGTDKDELEFEMKIKADWAQNGAVTLEADSRDFGKLEAEIAKVTPAYTVETKVTSIKKGESLATADVVIKEAKAGMLDTDNFLVLNLRDRNSGTLTFGADYKVEATNGMKISDGLYDNEGATRNNLDSMSIEIKTSSSKEAATITISGLMVKVDGSTVDGDKMIETYLVEKAANATKSNGTLLLPAVGSTPAGVRNKATAVEYALSKEADLDPDYSVKYVNAVKEYGTVATTTVFKIGSKEYTVNGETKTANEAPFISGKGYTMLPVRAVGEALGLKADWNAATKTATFSNDSKVASVVIGADTMYVNGTPFKLSAKAEIKNGSTFVELRSLASAFGVKLEWDAATKSVTIQG